MTSNRDTLYTAFFSRDPRFDGRIFVGVVTTGIYCRPICPARKPMKENCRFFRSAAEAESEGFRPCARCRPENAPGTAPIDQGARIAAFCASEIESETFDSHSFHSLAAQAGVSDRHLRRIFGKFFGIPPSRYVQTKKLHLARRLLLETDLSVLDVSLAAGFGSVRRMNELFQTRYRSVPKDLRRTPRSRLPDSFTVKLDYRPPYAWNHMLEFLEKRAMKGVESITGNFYRRSVVLKKEGVLHDGWLSVTRDEGKNILLLQISTSLLPVLSQVQRRIIHLFDSDCRPDIVRKSLGPLGDRVPGLRVPGVFDGFEMAVRSVLGQQVSVLGARTLADRLIDAFGEGIETPFPEISRTFPGPDRIASLAPSDLSGMGIFRSRVTAILGLADAFSKGTISLSPVPDVQAEMRVLRSLPGIGEWTAQLIAMRALAWPDAFPHTDAGIMKALNVHTPRKIIEIAEQWRPWRAYAAIALWHSAKESS